MASLAVLIVPALCFARAVPYPFVRSWDDGRFILDNPAVLHPSWDALLRMFTTVQFEAYHPLHLLSYWLDVPWVSRFGDPQLTATVVHAVSLGLWIAGLQISYRLMCALELPPWAAAVGTLAFGVHPAQVEVVSWASGRKDVLALLFVAASLRLHLAARGALDARAWLSRGLYLCALLSKTTALPLPLLAIALDWYVRRRSLRSAVVAQLPSCLLGAAVGAGVLAIWHEHSMVRQTLGDASLALVRFTQTLGHQLLTAAWPSRVSPMYATQSIKQLEWARSLACGVYVFTCALAVRKQRRLSAFGLLGFSLWLLPAANLVPLYFPLQDRYISLPLFSLGIAVAGLAAQPQAAPGKARSPLALRVLAAVALPLLAARTLQYEAVWQSELRLWGHAVQAQPDAAYAYLKLGEVRREAGDYEGAIAAYQGAIRIAPLRKLAHAGLFEAVARRDERMGKLQPSRARQLAEQYYLRLSSAERLRSFPTELWSLGYTRSAELPLQALLILESVPDGAIAQSAMTAWRAGRLSLARFYVHELREPPQSGPLAALHAQPYFRVAPALSGGGAQQPSPRR